MKDKWNVIDFKSGIDDRIIRNIIAGRRVTALDRLEKRYRRMGVLCLIFAVLIPLEMLFVFDVEERWLLFWTFAAFFLVAASMDFWLSNGIATINVYDMSVSEIVNKAMGYRKRHLQFELVLIPMAAILIAELGSFLAKGNAGIWIAIAVGGLVGLSIALRLFFKFMRDYKRIQNG